MRRKRIRIPFEDCASAVPIVKVKVKGRTVSVLVDTGSETTLFNKDFIKSINADYTPEGDNATFIGVNGESQKTPAISAKIECFFERKFELMGMLANLNPIIEHFAKIYGDKYRPHILLGGDNLERLDAKIDYEKKEMTILI